MVGSPQGHPYQQWRLEKNSSTVSCCLSQQRQSKENANKSQPVDENNDSNFYPWSHTCVRHDWGYNKITSLPSENKFFFWDVKLKLSKNSKEKRFIWSRWTGLSVTTIVCYDNFTFVQLPILTSRHKNPSIRHNLFIFRPLPWHLSQLCSTKKNRILLFPPRAWQSNFSSFFVLLLSINTTTTTAHNKKVLGTMRRTAKANKDEESSNSESLHWGKVSAAANIQQMNEENPEKGRRDGGWHRRRSNKKIKKWSGRHVSFAWMCPHCDIVWQSITVWFFYYAVTYSIIFRFQLILFFSSPFFLFLICCKQK